MIKKRQVLLNAMISMVQVLVISGVLFFLYRFLLRTLGARHLGIWSVVLAVTLVTQISDFGLSGSVVKFVAKYVARGEEKNVSGVIQTSVLTVGAMVTLILIVGYPLIRYVLRLIIPQESLPLAYAVLPYAFLAFWFMFISGVFQSALDGFQRIDIRGILLMGSEVFHLLLCFVLAPAYGLMGLAYARILQNFAILAASWTLLKRQLPSLPLIPYRWDKKLFKEMIGYGINFQVMSITNMLLEPTTKALLSRFGGLSTVAYFEMASKMVRQLRAVIVAAIGVIVPMIADLQEKAPEKIRSVYKTSYQLLFYLSLPLYSGIVVGIPVISKLWIGTYQMEFISIGIILAAGWFLNMLNVPAYFSNAGLGELRWNVICHLTTAVLNIILGVMFGILYQGMGVVVGWSVSLSLGSSIVYIAYHLRHKIPFKELFPRTSRMLASACLVGLICFFIIQKMFNKGFENMGVNGICVLIFSLCVFIPVWFHPMRRRLGGWIQEDLLRGRQEAL
ncbi:MAG: oligosaccharide flippase family protein [Candidatus Aminicenantales bacterium]